MERVHLPIVEEPRQELKTEREGSPEVNKKIAYAFLRQRYPLSERGRELQHRVRNAMDNGNDKAFEKLADDLPTVEEPHLELFEDFNLSVEDEEETFGRKIAVNEPPRGRAPRYQRLIEQLEV